MKAARRIELKGTLPMCMHQETVEAFAHDMRTPMSCVQGAAQLALLAGRQGKDVSEQLEQIVTAIQAMDVMLDRLCDAQSEGTAREFTSGALRRELQALTAQRAREKQQLLSIDLSALEGAIYVADDAALTRVLLNLLGNALKYTQPGGMIALRAQRLPAARPWETEAARLRFVVSDNGMGMKHAFLRRMYQPFVRAKESSAQPGRGLGLSIVRELVRRMDGTIRVHSEWGKGTVFVVTVPVRMAMRKKESPAEAGRAYVM